MEVAAEREISQMIDLQEEMRTKIIRLQKQVSSQTSGHESDSEASSDGGTLMSLNTTTITESCDAAKIEERRKLSKKYRKKIAKLSRVHTYI